MYLAGFKCAFFSLAMILVTSRLNTSPSLNAGIIPFSAFPSMMAISSANDFTLDLYRKATLFFHIISLKGHLLPNFAVTFCAIRSSILTLFVWPFTGIFLIIYFLYANLCVLNYLCMDMQYNLPSQKGGSKPSPIAGDPDDSGWYHQWAKWMISQWKNGGCLAGESGFTHRSEETIYELRAYGRGDQDPMKYRKVLDKQVRLENGKKGWLMNISWRPPQVYPTFRERIIDRLLEVRMDPEVQAIDDASIERKNLRFLRDKIASSPMGKSMVAKTGYAPSNVSDIALQMSPAEVDALKAMGGYSLATEIAIAEATKATYDICRIWPTMYRQHIEDLVDLGLAHIHIHHNEHTKFQQVDYIDPEMAVVPKSKYDDCRDVTWSGFFRPMSIAELREEIQNSHGSVDEQVLFEIAKTYKNSMGNDTLNIPLGNMGQREEFASRRSYTYDKMTVMVFTGYFVAAETEAAIVGIHDSGSRVYKTVSDDTRLKPGSEEKGFSIKRTTYQNVYRFNYVVGSEVVYGHGKDDVIIRSGLPGAMQAMIPILTYKTNRKSMTQACISAIDDLAIAVYKKRHIISKMPAAPNISINLDRLEKTTQLGTMVLNPVDLLDVYTIRGVLFTSDTNEYSQFNQGTPSNPIDALPSTTLDQLQAIQLDIELAMQDLRDITGTDKLTDGSANPTNVLNATVEAFQNSSNRALSFLYTANTGLQEMMNSHIARRYQAVAAMGGTTLRYIPVKSDTVKIIDLTPDISFADFVITSKPSIDNTQRQLLLAQIETYKAGNMLNAADEFAATNMILKGEYQKAQLYLSMAIDKKRKADAADQQAAMRAQSEAQAQAAVVAEQEKQKTITIQGEIDNKNIQTEWKMRGEIERMKLQQQAVVNQNQQ